MRWTLWTCPKREALLTAASHISHSSRHVPQCSRSFYAPPPPHPLTSQVLLSTVSTAESGRSYQELIITLGHPIGTHQSILIAALFFCPWFARRFPTATPSRITNLGPNSHLDGSRCHIRPAFCSPLLPERTTHLALEHPHYSNAGPRRRLKKLVACKASCQVCRYAI